MHCLRLSIIDPLFYCVKRFKINFSVRAEFLNGSFLILLCIMRFQIKFFSARRVILNGW